VASCRRGGGDLGELTAREREVVLAAADGADTRVITGRLFLIKHLTLGSGLNLTDGLVVRLPGGEHVQLFLAARPSGSAGLTGPTQNG